MPYLEVELCRRAPEVDPRLRYVHHIGAPGRVPDLGRGLAVKKQLAALKIGWGRGAEGGGCSAECVCGGGGAGRVEGRVPGLGKGVAIEQQIVTLETVMCVWGRQVTAWGSEESRRQPNGQASTMLKVGSSN